VQTGDEPSGNFPTSRQFASSVGVCYLHLVTKNLWIKEINIKYGFLFCNSPAVLSVQ
jgi:hypothetical protein